MNEHQSFGYHDAASIPILSSRPAEAPRRSKSAEVAKVVADFGFKMSDWTEEAWQEHIRGVADAIGISMVAVRRLTTDPGMSADEVAAIRQGILDMVPPVDGDEASP